MSLLAFERRWAAAVLAGFAPREGPGLAPRPGEVDYLGAHLRIYEATAPLGRLALRLAVLAAATSPIWLLERFRTFPSLPEAERARLLGRLLRMKGPVSELMVLLKMTASIALLGTPSVRARSGFDRASHA